MPESKVYLFQVRVIFLSHFFLAFFFFAWISLFLGRRKPREARTGLFSGVRWRSRFWWFPMQRQTPGVQRN